MGLWADLKLLGPLGSCHPSFLHRCLLPQPLALGDSIFLSRILELPLSLHDQGFICSHFLSIILTFGLIFPTSSAFWPCHPQERLNPENRVSGMRQGQKLPAKYPARQLYKQHAVAPQMYLTLFHCIFNKCYLREIIM